jgi:hypothetical protein
MKTNILLDVTPCSLTKVQWLWEATSAKFCHAMSSHFFERYPIEHARSEKHDTHLDIINA